MLSLPGARRPPTSQPSVPPPRRAGSTARLGAQDPPRRPSLLGDPLLPAAKARGLREGRSRDQLAAASAFTRAGGGGGGRAQTPCVGRGAGKRAARVACRTVAADALCRARTATLLPCIARSMPRGPEGRGECSVTDLTWKQLGAQKCVGGGGAGRGGGASVAGARKRHGVRRAPPRASLHLVDERGSCGAPRPHTPSFSTRT